MRTRLLWIVAAVALAGACQSVDPDELPSVEGYTSWYRLDYVGPIPGHSDSVRVVYVNDAARDYAHSGPYPVGSVIVKEVRARDGNAPGDIDYIAIMRKVGKDADVSPPVEGGWVFTQRDEGGSERWLDLCWASCHRKARIDGAWYDYGI